MTTEHKIAVLEQLIVEYDRKQHPWAPILKSVCKDVRAQTSEVQHSAFKALSHQMQAAKRQKARLGFVDTGVERALVQTLLAHWSAIERMMRHALQDAYLVKAQQTDDEPWRE